MHCDNECPCIGLMKKGLEFKKNTCESRVLEKFAHKLFDISNIHEFYQHETYASFLPTSMFRCANN